MKTRTILKAVLLLSGLLLALVAAPAAQAQNYGPTPGISVDNPTVTQGNTVTVRGTACTPGSTVTVSMNGSAVGNATVLSDGTWVLTFTVPASTTPGSYTVSASGCVSGTTQSTSINVLSASTTSNLPLTGSSTQVPVTLAIVLIAAGGLLVFAASRRKAVSVA